MCIFLRLFLLVLKLCRILRRIRNITSIHIYSPKQIIKLVQPNKIHLIDVNKCNMSYFDHFFALIGLFMLLYGYILDHCTWPKNCEFWPVKNTEIDVSTSKNGIHPRFKHPNMFQIIILMELSTSFVKIIVCWWSNSVICSLCLGKNHEICPVKNTEMDGSTSKNGIKPRFKHPNML